MTLKEFNTTFQQRTQGAWNVFRMRGTSGGMYLNKLVKYINDEMLASHLRCGLRLPEDTREGQRQDRKSTRLNSSHQIISYAVFCLKKKTFIYTPSDSLNSCYSLTPTSIWW